MKITGCTMKTHYGQYFERKHEALNWDLLAFNQAISLINHNANASAELS